MRIELVYIIELGKKTWLQLKGNNFITTIIERDATQYTQKNWAKIALSKYRRDNPMVKGKIKITQKH